MFRFLSKRSLRTFSTSPRRFSKLDPEFPDPPKDFRPPWIYTFARVSSNLSIITVVLYAVFVYDFGNDDHVFQPVRRWVNKQKSSFFALSPAEQRMIESEKSKNSKNGGS